MVYILFAVRMCAIMRMSVEIVRRYANVLDIRFQLLYFKTNIHRV